MSHYVATTILEQLGGHRFTAMTGARGFVGDTHSLRFRITGARSGINVVIIRLNAFDTYDIEFIAVRKPRGAGKYGPETTVVQEYREGVYVDQLRAVFTAATGLATSL